VKRAVIFDLLGTLVAPYDRSDYRRLLAAMAKAVMVDAESFTHAWDRCYEERTLGRLGDVKAMIGHIADLAGGKPDDAQLTGAAKIRQEFTTTRLVPRAGVVEMLTDLRSSGVVLGLLSDCSIDLPEAWRASTLAAMFDVAAFSAELGVRKPDPRSYRWVSDGLGCKPIECLYVGDGGNGELTGALHVGMTPIRLAFAQREAAWVVGDDDYAAISAGSISQLRGLLGDLTRPEPSGHDQHASRSARDDNT